MTIHNTYVTASPISSAFLHRRSDGVPWFHQRRHMESHTMETTMMKVLTVTTIKFTTGRTNPLEPVSTSHPSFNRVVSWNRAFYWWYQTQRVVYGRDLWQHYSSVDISMWISTFTDVIECVNCEIPFYHKVFAKHLRINLFEPARVLQWNRADENHSQQTWWDWIHRTSQQVLCHG